MDMPIRDKSLQHTDQLAPLGSLQHLRVFIEVIVSYNNYSTFRSLWRSLSRTMITAPSDPYGLLSRTMITAPSGPYSFQYPLLRYMQT